MMRQTENASFRGVGRRQFLHCCVGAACSGCAALCGGPRILAAGPPATLSLPPANPTLRLVFGHPPPKREGWPYVDFPYEPRKKEILAKLQASLPAFRFVPVTVTNQEQLEAVRAADAEVDGYVYWRLGLPSPAGLVGVDRPVVFVNELYGGGVGRGVGARTIWVSSSDFKDAVEGIRLLGVIKQLRSSIMLEGVDARDVSATIKAIEESFGTKIRLFSSCDLDSAYEKADREEAARWAKSWMAGAEKVVEPSPAEIQRSGQMYVAMRDLMAENRAQAIAIDCLRFFYSGKMKAYPCLGFFQLNDDGYVGACEGDLQSAITMLVLAYLTGRPSYISDPVVDTAKKQVVYAHCVAPSKVFGPAGPRNPYHIRSHSEDRKGAAVRSLLPLNEVVTTLKFVPEQKLMVIHQGRAVENVDEDKACRTKLAVDFPNARKLVQGWQFGWHRVTVYGDYKERLEDFCQLLGFKVVEEGV